ncbi:oligoendopeptidase, pepF/M3 family [Clostridium cadaveris]|uniref:Oligoendopeptidase, pepF/M3 family n=2 Tax=Clostridium cadaveris TaxID=1529 RepID=A0A1I2PF92_9CLOT|nr:M3 family oligoendopeptidase [Clostridium cadaveris]MDM8311728.1 M3 family oligoendopeptidase [Clostridium cadaveris]MDU4953130.1 M3 family oligoendopeptidase [Clostridium sp.]SFG14822.1 oligoendopeptidase, pepF/M3 family [Clostridium cadaveris]
MSEELNMSWDLSQLYSSFQGEDFISGMKALDDKINEINNWAKNNLNTTEDAVRKMEEYLNLNREYTSLLGRLSSFSRLTLSANAKNSEAKKASVVLKQKETLTKNVQVVFIKWLGKLENIDEIINASEELKNHEFIIKELDSKNDYMLSEEVEVALSKMALTGSSSWENLRNTLTSNHMVPITIDGKEEILSINKVKNMQFSSDKTLRKIASEAERKSNKVIEEGVASALNGIKGEVITVCDMKGYKSPLSKTLIDARMDEETLNSMLEAMKESLNDFQKYFRKKAQLLGHKDKLPYYDIMAPISTSEKEYTYEETRDFIVKHFSSFSKDMGAMAERAFNDRWIDSEVRDGKRGGAFCSNLHVIKQSRILCSFSGSFKNVCTLAHELGHAYHGMILGAEDILNTKYPMPLAETASIFSETMVRNAALKDADKEEALGILGAELVNCASVIVDIYARFLFEKEVFERRKNGDLSVDEIKEIMVCAEKEAYGEAIDETTLDPYAWIHKPHYYFTERNFYNFPYAFGLLFAKGLYSQYLKEGDAFVEKYNKILSLTGKANIYDVTKFAGIDVHDINFWRSSLDIIRKDIEKFCQL